MQAGNATIQSVPSGSILKAEIKKKSKALDGGLTKKFRTSHLRCGKVEE